MDQGSAFALGALIAAAWIGIITSFKSLQKVVQQSLAVRDQQLRLHYTLLVEIREHLRATADQATPVAPRGDLAARAKPLLAEEAA